MTGPQMILLSIPALSSLPVHVARLVLWFTIYATGGWVYETIVCSIGARKLVRRGFLYGPCCPIYGVGAITVYVLLGRIADPLLLFVSGAVVATGIEYGTAALLENVFHQRWWSYDGWFLNIRGRVCLIGTLVFGGFTLLVVLVLQPMVAGLVDTLSAYQQVLLASMLSLVYLYDSYESIEHANPDMSSLPEGVRRVAAALPAGVPTPYELCTDVHGRASERVREVRTHAADFIDVRRRF